jgi:hypothetical protein
MTSHPPANRDPAATAGADARSSHCANRAPRAAVLVAVVTLVAAGLFFAVARSPSIGPELGTAPEPDATQSPSGPPTLAARPMPARPEQASEPSASAMVSGIVVDPGGTPIPGAKISLVEGKDVTASPLGGEDLGDNSASVVSGADGRFEIVDRPDRNYLVAVADRMARAVIEASRATGGNRIVLRPHASLEGEVLDSQGRAVGGARVRVVYWFSGGPSASAERVADGAGWYRFDSLPPLEASRERQVQGFVTTESAGLASATLRLPALRAGATERLDIVLSGGARIRGEVRDVATGSPIGGVRVLLISQEARVPAFRPGAPTPVNPLSPRVVMETKTLADGEYVLSGVPAHLAAQDDMRDLEGSLQVAVAEPGWVAATSPPIDVPRADTELRVDLLTRPACVLRGHAVDSLGAPVAGANVQVEDERFPNGDPWPVAGLETPALSAVTDEAGRYQLDGVPCASSGSVRIVGRLLGPRVRPLDREARLTVQAVSGGTSEIPPLVFRSRPAPHADLVVVDRRDRAVPDALVTPDFFEASVRSDPLGRVRLYWEGPESGHPVRIFAPGYATRLITLDARLKDIEPTIVRLDIGRRISGRVLGPDGLHPLPDVRVVAFREDRADNGGATSRRGRNVSGAVTDAEGRFELAGLEDADYTIAASWGEGVRLVGQPGARAEATVRAVHAGRADVLIRMQ